MAYTSAVRDIVAIGDKLFSERTILLRLWQTLAENFYPERAEFTGARGIGVEFSAGLMTSFPVMARRELGNLFASFLRPRSATWLALHCADEARDKDNAARGWLEWAGGVQWRAMYDPVAQFVRATKEADHDFATFGQAVISCEPNRTRDALLYRDWHLRDCAWSENYAGKVDTMHRRWQPTASQLVMLFPKTVDEKVRTLLKNDPNRTVNCRHIVVPASDYRVGNRTQFPFTSIYIDEDNQTVLEEIPLATFMYVVPRWATISGSQYARSPATELVLPDARLLQSITRVLLEAGEKAVDPPMVAVQEALRSDVNLFAGGLSFVDIEYDERTGEALRPAMDTSKGMPTGLDMAEAVKAAIHAGFFLNKLALPEFKTMTAYETRKRIEEYVRSSAPIFEPVEEEYNAPLCNLTFDVLMANGAFGPRSSVPPALQGTAISFVFKSPLREVSDEMKSQLAVQGLQLVEQITAVAPEQIANINMTQVVRDSLRGMGWPATWIAPEQAVMAKAMEIAKAQQAQAGGAALAAGADAANQFGQAANQISQATNPANTTRSGAQPLAAPG